jgi:hypothetical protein
MVKRKYRRLVSITEEVVEDAEAEDVYVFDEQEQCSPRIMGWSRPKEKTVGLFSQFFDEGA